MRGTKVPKRSGASLVAIAAAALAMLVAPHAGADEAGGGGDYVQLKNDAEVLDTRDGTGAAAGQRGAETTTVVPVLGVGGIPTTGVGSVLARASILDPSADTWLVLTPDGEKRSDTTAVAAQAGEDLSAFVAVEVGANGKLAVYQAAGKAHVVVEVHGYFKSSQGATGGGYVPVEHTRAVDTRTGLGTAAGVVPAGGSRTVTLTGGPIPAGATAAYVNLATPSATEGGWLSYAPAGGTARPVMNYAKGTTQQAAVVQLPADGQVTFTNRGGAPVNLMVNLEGYFTASATTGSGFREVGKRLLNTRAAGAGLPVAPNATVDVQVGGTHGLPTRGIAAALVSITTTSEEPGYVKAWPVGEPEPGLTVGDHGAGRRTNSVSVAPGTDGRIRIRNGSSGTSHVIVDLQGWFARPLPTVPVVRDSATTAFQAAPVAGARVGTLEYAYTDNAGRVVFGHQQDVDNFGSIQWTVISGSEAFTGKPAVVQLADGRIQVTAQNRDGDVWAIAQTAAGALTWGPWTDLGGSPAAAPTAAKLADGTPAQFAVDADGRLWVYQQKGSVPFWRNLGDQDLVGQVAVVAVRDGLRVVGLDGAGAVRTVLFHDDGSLSAWANLGGAGSSGTPSVVVRPGYQPQVFVRGASGSVLTKLQDAGGAWPGEWDEVGGGVVAAGAPSAVLDPALGRVAVVVRGADGEVHRVWETAVGTNTWGEWAWLIEGISDPAATDPTAVPVTNANGESWLVTFRSPNGTPRFVERRL
ncbi:hypothetical protein GCM10009634_31060 [Saccharothrix xinjiangensis]